MLKSPAVQSAQLFSELHSVPLAGKRKESIMKCPNCGNENPDGQRFCDHCGTELPRQQGSASEASFNQYYQSQQQNAPLQNYGEPAIPPEYRPITMWGYVGYSLLFSIPLVGLILILIFSFGGTTNINLRNYSRSLLCLMLIFLVIFLLVFSCSALVFRAIIPDYYY